MSARTLVGNAIRTLATSTALSVNSTTASAFDFGTPNDLYVPGLTDWKHEDRFLLLFVASAGTGTTDKVSYSIEDAPDSSGSIGTTAAVLATNLDGGSLAVDAVGDRIVVASVRMVSDRPWLRVKAVSNGTTDTFKCYCKVLGVPPSV